MKIKTNVRAGQGGADDPVDTADTSTSSSNQKQKGKSSGGGSTPTPVYTRCAGL